MVLCMRRYREVQQHSNNRPIQNLVQLIETASHSASPLAIRPARRKISLKQPKVHTRQKKQFRLTNFSSKKSLAFCWRAWLPNAVSAFPISLAPAHQGLRATAYASKATGFTLTGLFFGCWRFWFHIPRSPVYTCNRLAGAGNSRHAKQPGCVPRKLRK